MKMLVQFVQALFVSINVLNGIAYSANEQFRSIATGNWNSTSTWEMSFNGSTWFAATSTPSDTSGAITIRTPNVVTVTADAKGDQLTVQTGGTLSINNGIILTISDGSGNDFSMQNGSFVTGTGTVRTQGASIVFNLLEGSSFGAGLNVNTGITYAAASGSPFTARFYGPVTVDSAAILTVGPGTSREIETYSTVVNNGTISTSAGGNTFIHKGNTFENNGIINGAYFVIDSVSTLSGTGTISVYEDFYIGANGVVTMMSDINVSGSEEFRQIGSLNLNGNNLNFTNGTLIVYNGASITGAGSFQTFTSVVLNVTDVSNFAAALNVKTGTTWAAATGGPHTGRFYGPVTVDTGAILAVGPGTSREMEIYNDLTNNGLITTSAGGNSMMFFGETFTNNGVVNTANFDFMSGAHNLQGTGTWLSRADILNGATVNLTGNHNMHSVSISAGGTFNISNYTLGLTASNPIGQSGTFNTSNSTVEYNGTALQSITTANIIYHRLKINNALGTSLPGNVTVNDTLSVVLGYLNLNGRILTIAPGGYVTETPGNTVNGATGYMTTTRSLNAPSSLNVAGMGAILSTGVDLGATEIRRGHGIQSGLSGGTSISRYFDILPTNNTGLNATFIFKYDDSEIGTKPEASLKLYKSTNSGSTWSFAGGVSDPSANSITIANLTSFSRWSADSSTVPFALNVAMQGFYNSGKLNMRDTVRLYLRNSAAPYSIVDSAKSVIDSLTLTGSYRFLNAVAGNYYLQTKHRNSIETWSNAPITYSDSSILSYNFTLSAASAYGNNLALKETKYCLYSGDVNQDGNVDLSDITSVYNSSNSFASGYVVTDVNGDRVVDLADITITHNNSLAFVAVKKP